MATYIYHHKSGGFWHFLMVLFKHKHMHFTLILIISYLSENLTDHENVVHYCKGEEDII